MLLPGTGISGSGIRVADFIFRGSKTLSAQNSVLTHIARPYASALFDLAVEAGSVREVEAGLDDLAGLIESNKDFSNLLASPVISAEAKIGAVDAILAKAGLPVLVANFVRTVARNGRLFVLPVMIGAFRELSAKERGETRAEVTSAAPLSKTQLSNLSKTLKTKLGKTVTLDTHVDPSLIGGLVVKVGSRMIDSSLKTKLTAMKIAMKEVS